MTKEEFAKRFDGSDYPFRLSRDDRSAMKDLGLVVVFGASDDLMEFDGAIYDEVAAPGQAYIADDDLVQEPDCDCDAAEKLHQMQKSSGYMIECHQNHESAPDVYWSYLTTIPHATFRIMEDGDVNCNAIIFSLYEMRPV